LYILDTLDYHLRWGNYSAAYRPRTSRAGKARFSLSMEAEPSALLGGTEATSAAPAEAALSDASLRQDDDAAPLTNLAVPSYLSDYEAYYRENPRRAALKWFADARFGMFVHYALGSCATEGEGKDPAHPITRPRFKVLTEKNREAWRKISRAFTARKFDADLITDLALQAEMRYVNFTTVHKGGLFMFDTQCSTFTSLNAPCGRDLVAELAEACRRKGLGLFLYYNPDLVIRLGGDLDMVMTQLRELLTQYGPIAGIWLDPIGSFYEEPDKYPVDKIYAHIRALQPQCLVSWKQGANGDEDFVAPEGLMHPKGGAYGERIWEMNRGKPGEICTVMQVAPPAWLYIEGNHSVNADQTMLLLADAFAQKANLLLNVNPLPDGSLPQDQVDTLQEVGSRIRKEGFPSPKLLDRAVRKSWKSRLKE
jgi:alpha-L-fucosidase